MVAYTIQLGLSLLAETINCLSNKEQNTHANETVSKDIMAHEPIGYTFKYKGWIWFHLVE